MPPLIGCLGRRKPKTGADESCKDGVSFGDTVIDVDALFVYCGLILKAKRGTTVFYDVWVGTLPTFDFTIVGQQRAFTKLRATTAIEIEKLLRYVIDGRIDRETYDRELREWLSVEEIWNVANPE